MSLRPPSTPRSISSLPAPGSTPSSLPTPRRRVSNFSLASASSSATATASANGTGTPKEELESLRDAVRRNNPGKWAAKAESPDLSLYDSGGGESGTNERDGDSPTPSAVSQTSIGGTPSAARTRAGIRRPSTMGRPVTPSNAATSAPAHSTTFPRTPSSAHPRSKTPTGFGSSVNARFTTPSSKVTRGTKLELALELGDEVVFEVGGVAMEGIVRFLGEVDGKDGSWGGVELEGVWSGKGKNDGSVKGTQYFACPPLCGLFLPIAKISLKSSSTTMAPIPFPTLQPRSAAPSTTLKKYTSQVSMSPSTSAMLPPPPVSPTKPRRAPSPEKLESFPSSSSSAMTTPRPTARARQSLGPPTTRKATTSLSTPRQALPASVSAKHAPRSSNAPEVPSIPPNFTRSVTPSSSFGRRSVTPSMMEGQRRRMSLAASELSSRPGTPSHAHSQSQSNINARSISRQSFGSSTSGLSVSRRGEDGAVVMEELRRAREREAEMKLLLEGTERLGRELEEKLARAEDDVRERDVRIEGLEREREKERERERRGVDEKERERGVMEDGVARELEARLEELQREQAKESQRWEEREREWAREKEMVERRRDAREAEVEEERRDLISQLETLRAAGQALCQTYEDRIASIEDSRLESLELVESLESQLYALRNPTSVPSPPTSTDPTPDSESLPLSLDPRRSSAADFIDAENALADLEHMTTKVERLEEQLEEAKMHLEAEVADTRRRRIKSGEIELGLKKEIAGLRENLDRSTRAEQSAAERIEELEEALVESQTQLEMERAEVERLRSDGQVSLPASTLDVPDALKKAQQEAESLSRQLAESRRDLARNADLVSELRADLRLAERELDNRSSLIEESESPSVFNVASEGGPSLLRRERPLIYRKPSTPVQQTTQDVPSLLSSPGRRDSVASNSSKRSIGTTGTTTGKDEVTSLREQIVGLKVIIESLTVENQKFTEKVTTLEAERGELKDAHHALEATVENLMAEMANGTSMSLESPGARDRSSRLSIVPRQREIDELRSKLEQAEKKAEKEIKALNQEVCLGLNFFLYVVGVVAEKELGPSEQVAELESLIESKIYREDELELELERYKLLESKSGVNGATRNGNGTSSRVNGVKSKGVDEDEEDECEMCGETGHQLDQCPIFGGATESTNGGTSSTATGLSSSDLYCDDCETHGHALEDCPLANDVF